MAERGPQESPDRVTAEPDGQENEQEPAHWLTRNGVKRALLVRQLPRVAHRDLERQQPDDPVDHATGNKAGAGENLEPPRGREALADAAGESSG